MGQARGGSAPREGATFHGRAAVELAGTILVRGLAVLRLVLIGRLFGPDSYGLFATAATLLILPQSVLQAGFRPHLVRMKKAQFEESFWAVGLLAGAFALGGYLLLAGLAMPVEAILAQPGLGLLLLLMGVGMLEGVWQVLLAALDRDLRFGRARVLEAGALSVALGVLVLLALRGVAPEWCLAWSFAASAALKGPLLRLGTGRLPRFGIHRAALRPALSFALPLMGGAVLAYVANRGDDLAVRVLHGPAALGIYVLAFYVPTLLQDFVDSVNRVSLPLFSRAGDREALRDLFRSGVRLSATVTAPVGFGGAIFAGQIVEAVFGSAWLEAVPLLRVFFLAFALRAATGMNWTALALLQGRTRYVAGVAAASAAFLVVVGVPLIWWLGPIGGAVYTLVQLSVMGPLVRFPVIRSALGDLRALSASVEPLLVAALPALGLWWVGAAGWDNVPGLAALAAYLGVTVGWLMVRDPELRSALSGGPVSR